MVWNAILLIVAIGSWTTFYLAFNPTSYEFEGILFLEGFMAMGVACTMTCTKLIYLNPLWGMLISIGIVTYSFGYAVTAPERCTKRRLESETTKAV